MNTLQGRKRKEMNRIFPIALIILIANIFYATGSVTTLKIPPKKTDSNISSFYSHDHVVKFDSSKIDVYNPRIVVILPGSYGRPENQEEFHDHAASMGYLSIGLMYPNDPTVGSLCEDDTSNKYCYWDVRREIVQGDNFSDKVDISPSNSVLNRLQKLLSYLQNEDPIAGFPWMSFYDSPKPLNQSIIWENITIGGHSQGGGHATLIGYLYNSYKILTFSSTCDKPLDGYYWTHSPPEPRVSDSSKFFGFIHKIDPICYAEDNWNEGGYLSRLITVDASNQGGSRQLCSNWWVDCYSAHGSTIVDHSVPRQWNGKILISDTWSFLLSADPNDSVKYSGDSGQECKMDHCNIVGFFIWIAVLILLICPLPLVSIYFYNSRILSGKIPFKGSCKSLRCFYILDYVIYLIISVVICTPLYIQHLISHYLYWALISIGFSALESFITIQYMKKMASDMEDEAHQSPLFSNSGL